MYKVTPHILTKIPSHVLVTILLMISVCFADHSYSMYHLSIEDGLSQATVYDIVQDSRGFMWFGTEDGLNRYDGYDFTVYRNLSYQEHTIGGNFIYRMYIDSRDILWVGTYDGGLNQYDQVHDEFIQYRYDPADKTTIASDIVWDILEDSTGTIWVGTEGGGLNWLNRDTGKFTRFLGNEEAPFELSAEYIYTLYKDKQERIWIAADSGIFIYLPGTGRIQSVSEFIGLPPIASLEGCFVMLEDDTGKMWFGTESHGVTTLDPATGQVRNYMHDPDDPSSINNNYISDIIQDQDGDIWIATYEGLSQYQPDLDMFHRYRGEPVQHQTARIKEIQSLFEDRQGLIWLGVGSTGISTIDKRSQKFGLVSQYFNCGENLSDDIVLSFLEDQTGRQWVGTAYGLNYRDNRDEPFQRFLHDPGDPTSLSNDNVWHISEDSHGDIWIGTEHGLNKWSYGTGTFQQYHQSEEDSTMFNHDTVYYTLEDARGRLWIGTLGGLLEFDRENGVFVRYPFENTGYNTLKGRTINVIYEDRFGILWFGTYSGLVKYDQRTETFTKYNHDPADNTSLTNDQISSITEDDDGNLWIGTVARGFSFYDRDEDEFESFGRMTGFPTNIIHGVAMDGNRNLWISSNQGIFRFMTESKTWWQYSTADGLQSSEFNEGSVYTGRDGSLYFGGIRGYNYFQPDQILSARNQSIPPVVLTGFNLFYQPVPIHSASGFSLGKHISFCDEVILSHEQNIISLEFAALNYIHPERNQYAFMLEGYDEDWIYCGTRRYVEYTNLPYGEFTFRVKASNNNGVWNEEGTSLRIVHNAPFWISPYFRLFVVLVLLGLVWMLNQARNFRIQSANRKLSDVNQQLLNQIEQRKIAEKELTEVKDRLEIMVAEATKKLSQERDLFIGGQVVVFKWEGKLESRVTYVSPNVVNLFGYSAAEFVEGGMLYNSIIHPKDRKQVDDEFEQAVAAQSESLMHRPYRALRKDGTTIWLQDFTTIIPGSEVNDLDALGYVVDITEQVNAENQLKENQAQLVHAGRLASLGEMATGIAHELNQPLSIIRAQIELLSIIEEKKGLTDDSHHNEMSMIMNEVDRAAEIINHMRGFAHKQDGEDQLIDLSEPIRHSLVFFKQQFKVREIQLNVEIADNLPLVRINQQQFEQIVVNFISNARHAVENRSDIQDPSEPKRIDVFLKCGTDPETVELQVRDNGHGMSAEEIDRCLEPFFTTKEVGQGTGLGLSIAHNLVTEFGGRIEIKSEVNVGTSIRAIFLTDYEKSPVSV